MPMSASRDGRPITELYWSHIAEQLAKIVYHAVNILTSIYKAMPFAVSNFANDVECVELQPFHEITDDVCRRKQGISLVEEPLGCAVDIRFILYQGAHRKGMVHRPPQICMVMLIGRGE